MQDLHSFLAALHFSETDSQTYSSAELGSVIQKVTDASIDFSEADIVLVGCGEMRGSAQEENWSIAPDAIRQELYKLYAWHPSLKIADLGNLLQGANKADSEAALFTVLHELKQAGKKVFLLGGSHDLTLQQYLTFKRDEEIVNGTVVDMLIDLEESETVTESSFLLDMLSTQPNYLNHYTHLGFQSYYVPPRMLETLDKLRFDCVRLGKLRTKMEEAEPYIRQTHFLSFDVKAIRYSDAPANMNGSPNGLTGDEACQLMRYAGMSTNCQSVGVYGYLPQHDQQNLTARQVAQMIWYYVDGCAVAQTENDISNREGFKEFHVGFTNNDTLFLKSKRTQRWWMQLPNKSFIACSEQDYLDASADEIPERWLREQERLL